jgi:protein-L-isoaspartate(D-aspartate) O-methyltransferase
MVDVITIHADLSSEEIGKSALDERVLDVMRELPRHLFVPAPVAAAAYEDMPLPIGFDKTISQPFMVALMTDLLDPQPADDVLEARGARCSAWTSARQRPRPFGRPSCASSPAAAFEA